ncbi:unnamed protein product [Sympodiomycopsis kandeliae]
MDSTSTNTRKSHHDGQPELTGRAVIVGILVGSLLCFTNCYFGLQSSWISLSSLQAALVGYGVVKLLPKTTASDTRAVQLPSTHSSSAFWSWFGQGPLRPQENVVLQATAVACAAMPLTVGLIGIVPALLQIKPEKDHGALPVYLSDGNLLLWCAALSWFGVFFASPLRKRVIIKEKLTFPSGTAVAHLIGVLHNVTLRSDEKPNKRVDADEGERETQRPAANGHIDANGQNETVENPNFTAQEADTAQANFLRGSQGWHTLLYSLTASLIFTIASSLFPVLYAIPIFDVLPPHNLSTRWGWYFTPSLSYIGQGIIMGFHTTASMLAGAIFGWAFLSPLAHHRGWTDSENPMDAEKGSKAWILWVSLAVMTSESTVGLVAVMASELKIDQWKDWLSKSQGKRRRLSRSLLQGSPRIRSRLNGQQEPLLERDDSSDVDKDEEDDEPPSRLPQPSVVGIGIITSTLFALVAIWYLFGREGIEPYTTVLAIVLAFALSILAVRSLGTTDLNPVSALGKITQLIFAVIQPHNIVANMVAGGLSEAGAMQAGELMQDFKTGHLVGASPRAQFYGQIIGSTVGIFVSAFAYQLYTKVYTIPSPSFPAPAATMWLNFARLVNDGEIPRESQPWLIGCAVVFGVNAVLKTLLTNRKQSPQSDLVKYLHYLPSGVAFAVGILNTPNFSIARFLGGCLTLWSSKSSKPKIFFIILASGFVLGEGAGSILNLFAKQWNVYSVLSCWGCRGACGGNCSL